MRKKHSAEFKTKVAIEAIKGMKTIAELSAEYGIHSTQITKWKKQLLSNAPSLFSDKIKNQTMSHDHEMEKLYAQIGKLKVENDFLKKAVYPN